MSCSGGSSRSPPAFPLDLTSSSNEVESALQATTEMLSQVTRLLALVSAPPLEVTHVRHVEVLLLQPQLVMVVVITSAGGVSKRLFHFEEPVDAGLAQWASDYLNEAVAGLQLGTGLLRRRFEDPGLSPPSTHSSTRSGRRSPSSSPRSSDCTSAGAADPARRGSGQRRWTRTEACSSSSSAGPTLLDVLGQPSTVAADVRPALGHELVPPRPLAEIAARRCGAYGLVHPARSAPSASSGPPPGADGLREGARGVRSAALELSHFVESILRRRPEFARRPSLHSDAMATTDRDYYELLGIRRRRARPRSSGPFRQLAR
jgi:heat-inducible transcriptional repressor